MPSPSDQRAFDRLLHEALSGRDAHVVIGHLRGCSDCRAALELDADSSVLRQHAADWRSAGGAARDPVWEKACMAVREAVLATAHEQATQPGDAFANYGLGPPVRGGDLGSIGPYAVEAVLGRGGMGTVFRAFEPALGRTVAVKMLRPDSADPKARLRIVQEARVAAGIRHDHVLAIHAVADPPGALPYLVLEYLEGPTLGQLIAQGRRLEPAEAARLVVQAARGLAAVHSAGIIHRDIKPGNIMLDGTAGRAKLMDFGLARQVVAGGGLTQDGTVAGTPAYMSPEQAGGGELDARSDLYSLGATLYEALTGEAPFRGATPLVLHQVVNDEPLPPTRLADGVPKDLETICLKAMAKEPSARYASAAELADDLERWQRGEPIRARRTGVPERLWRWCRRQPAVSALLVGLALSLAGGFAAVTWQWRRAEAGWEQSRTEGLRADAGFANARQAVDSFYTQISQNELVRAPGLDPLRKQLLEQALRYYDRFIAESADDPALEQERVHAAMRLAMLSAELGTTEEQRSAHDRWVELARRFAQRRPDDFEAQRLLAISLSHAAVYRDLPEGPEQGLAALAEAGEIWERLAAERPGDPRCESYLAGNDSQVGELNAAAGRLKAGQAALRRACERFARLSADHPDDLNFQDNLARARFTLGEMISATDPAEALDLFTAAAGTFRRFSSPGTFASEMESYLARCLLGRCRALAALDRNEAALEELARTREYVEGWCRDHPDLALGRRLLAGAACETGAVQSKLERHGDALTALSDARQLAAELVSADPLAFSDRALLAAVLYKLAQAHAAAGDRAAARSALDEALAEQEQVVEQAPRQPRYREDLDRYRQKKIGAD